MLPRRQLFYAVVASFFLVFAGFTLIQPLSDWIPSDGNHRLDEVVSYIHLFNYFDFGFIKRGLIGSALRLTGLTPTQPHLLLASVFAALTMVLSFWAFFADALRSSDEESAKTWAVLALLTPGLFLNQGYMLGFQDLWCLAFFYLALLLTARNGMRATAGIVILSVLGLLTYESFLPLFLPLLLVTLFRRGQTSRLVTVTLTALIVTGCLFLWGSFATIEESIQVSQAAAQGLDWSVQESDTNMTGILSRTVIDSFHFTMERYARPIDSFNMLLIALWLVPFLILFLKGTRLQQASSWPSWLVSLSPLLVLPVARDVQRWVALVTVNLLIFALLEIREKRLDPKLLKLRSPLFVFLLVSLLAGPIGKHKLTFPLVWHLFGYRH